MIALLLMIRILCLAVAFSLFVWGSVRVVRSSTALLRMARARRLKRLAEPAIASLYFEVWARNPDNADKPVSAMMLAWGREQEMKDHFEFRERRGKIVYLNALFPYKHSHQFHAQFVAKAHELGVDIDHVLYGDPKVIEAAEYAKIQ